MAALVGLFGTLHGAFGSSLDGLVYDCRTLFVSD